MPAVLVPGLPARRLRLDGQPVTVDDVVAVSRGGGVELGPAVRDTLKKARTTVERLLAADAPVYGLTTRLGAGRNERVSRDELADFQNRIIDNHRGGFGEPLPGPEVRALVFARVVGFAQGGSGVRPELAGAYAALLDPEAGPLPEVYRTGSVGASDLAPLAEIAATVRDSIPFAANEALAAISANAYSLGVGALAVAELRELAAEADLASALSLEALAAASTGGNLSPFDARLHAVRRSPGQARAAAAVREHLAGGLLDDPARQVSVQDALSFRTIPQMHGALRDAVERAVTAVEDELNAPGDNPLVVTEPDAMISGGNFEPLGFVLAFESLRVALAHLAALSERRTAVLSGLITPLRREGRNVVPGISAYASAALLAEVRHLANPVSTSATVLSEIEDHASFAPLTVQLVQRQLVLVRQIFAVEALHAAELLRWKHADSTRSLGRGTGPLARLLGDALGAALDSNATTNELVAAAVKAVRAVSGGGTIEE